LCASDSKQLICFICIIDIKRVTLLQFISFTRNGRRCATVINHTSAVQQAYSFRANTELCDTVVGLGVYTTTTDTLIRHIGTNTRNKQKYTEKTHGTRAYITFS